MNSEQERLKKAPATEKSNPFPGLRPFGIEESHLFFGREKPSKDVLYNLVKYRFSAVTGSSGSGKSSLIYCGVIPLLYGGFIKEAGTSWKVIKTRPGNNPIENLSEAICNFEKEYRKDNVSNYSKSLIQAVLHRSSSGLAESLKQLKLSKDDNILLIFDQFEELFRYSKNVSDPEAYNATEEYIKLIVETVKQQDLPIYVIVTMRSDFVGECTQFYDFTELINSSNYLIPRMTRENFRKAIEGPIAVSGEKISKDLIQLLLNNIDDKSDQLSILQHAMMRMWEHWLRTSQPGEPLSIRNYEAIGKLDKALSLHADEAFQDLNPEGKKIAEKIFKSLTELGSENYGIRHPERISVIAKIANVEPQDIIEVIEVFRQNSRSFLLPPDDVKLGPETIVDISHESLMRIWDRLRRWVEEESNSVQMYQRLVNASSLYQEGKSGLWRPPELHLAIQWRNKTRPTLTWARRYHPAFERAMVFLDTSEDRYRSEERHKVRIQKRALKRSQMFALIMALAALFGLGLMFYANSQKEAADRNRTLAEERRKEADSLRMIALMQKDQAVEKSMMAEEEREIAIGISEEAMLESEIARYRRMLAEMESQQAKIESDKLRLEQEVTRQQLSQVEEKVVEEVKKKQKAQEETVEQYKKRMYSVSRTLLAKSLTLSADKDLRGLLALQGYYFHKEYGGSEVNNEVYTALYYAVKNFMGDKFNTFEGHTDEVKAIAFYPQSNRFFSTGGDGQILESLAESNTKKMSGFAKTEFINYSISVSNDGRWMAVGTFDSKILLFNVRSSVRRPMILSGHSGIIGSLVFSPDNQSLFSVAEDKTIKKWDLRRRTFDLVDSISDRIRSIALSPDGRFLIGGTDGGRLIEWDLKRYNSSIIFQNSRGNAIYSVAYSNDGSLISFGDKQGFVKVFNASTKKLAANLKGHSARVNIVTFSPNSKFMATAGMDSKILIWDAVTYEENPIEIIDHESWVFGLAFSYDNKYLISSSRTENLVFKWFTQPKYLSEELCGVLNRNMSQEEWRIYIANDIEYQKTCANVD
jgi:hypothetical protein